MTLSELQSLVIWPSFLPVLPVSAGGGYHEALLRTSHPAGHIAVIQAAERAETIWQLDIRMLRVALDVLAKTRPALRIGVNVSAVTVQRRSDAWLAELARWRQLASRIVVELTETAEHTIPGETIRFVAACRAMGAKIAIDDYDTGSFDDELVAALRPDFIKLGNVWKGSFGGQEERALLAAVRCLDRMHCVNLVVEWVDSEEKRSAAKVVGVTHMQGSCVARHVDLDGIKRLFGDTKTHHSAA
jgi:EAL domain-containing protein (putative c-di-GMP-specific phosphodiesterase class I)